MTKTLTALALAVAAAATPAAHATSFADLAFHYATSDTQGVAGIKSFYTDFVLNGPAAKRSLTVSLDDGGLTMTFGGAGIHSLGAEEEQSDNAYLAKVFTERVALSGADTGP